MIKSELISELAEKENRLTKEDVGVAVDSILEQIAKTLAKGEHIEVRGFGSFSINYQEPRIGRNPKTGEPVHIKGKNRIRFKPGKELRERLNKTNSI